MYVNLIHAIILSHDEAEDIRKEGGSFDFDICASGDYIVHAVYDKYNQEVIYLEDNIHGRPDEVLEGIEIGLRTASRLVSIQEMVLELPKGADPYSYTAVVQALREAVE